MNEQELRAKYDGMSVKEIHEAAIRFHSTARDSHRQFYESLEYLRITRRYKELPGYKKAIFWTYLEDNFALRKATYEENVRAYLKYPEFAVRYGVGLVSKVMRTCGQQKVKPVLDQIVKEQDAKKKPIPRAKIETIINQYKKPVIKREVTEWKVMYERECAAHERTRAALKEAMARIHELEEQNERLKRTAETFGEVRALFDRHNHAAVEMRPGM